MPLLKFRNYLSASRKPNMIAFGMFKEGSNLDHIEGLGTSALAVTGTQDGSNQTFTLSASPDPTFTLVIRNGLVQKNAVDFTIAGTSLTFLTPPAADDIILVLPLGGAPSAAAAGSAPYGPVVPVGVVDGENDTFTLPVVASSMWLFVDGLLAIQGTHYTFSNPSITITDPAFVPTPGGGFVAFYWV